MKALAEIKAAIDKLPRKEFWRLAKWFDRRKDEVWDKEMQEDARPGGPLDKLFRQAVKEHKAGLTIPLDEVLRSSPEGSRPRKRSPRRR